MEVGLSLIVGLILGLLVVFTPSLPLPADYQKLVYVIPFAITVVILFNNLDRLILAVMAISVPLNLDVSVIVSPYARNIENVSKGYRTLIAPTELRISLVTVVLAVGFMLWLLRTSGGERKPIRFFPATTIPALGFIGLSALSIVQAQDQQLWFFRIAELVELFLVYFYLANHIRTNADMQFFVLVSLGGMLVEEGLMIVQWVTGLSFTIAGIQASLISGDRVAGTFGFTGPAAGYLTSLGLIAFALLWGFTKKSNQRLAIASFGFGIVALVSTGSRIGWISFAVTLLALILFGRWQGWIKTKTLALLALGGLALGIAFFGIISTRFIAYDYGSAASRPMMWKLAWRVIQAHPWLGVGAGNYALITRNYYTPDIGLANEVLDIQLHNAYLNVWAESGIFALLCYLGVLGVSILKAWSCRGSPSQFVSKMGIGLGLAILSLCIQMATDTFHMSSINLFVWLMVALAASLPYLEHENDADISATPKNMES